MLGIVNDTDLQVGLRGKRQPVRSTKALVFRWVEIFNHDLKLDGLGKFADLSRAFLAIVSDILALSVGKNIPHGVFQNFGVNFRHNELLMSGCDLRRAIKLPNSQVR